jgi:ABC-type uncharacterized transport system involved in gliding motility auxiliary subunit
MPLGEDFKWARKIKLVNKVLGVACILLIFLGINILSMRHFYRFDFQKKHNFALEDFSLKVIEFLEDPVEIFLFYSHSQDDSIPFFVNDLRTLLKEYKHAAPNRIRVKFIDMVQQPRMTDELSLKFGAITANSVIIASREHFRVIPTFDLYEFKDGVATGFRGERVISDEILKFSNRDAKKVLFATGHGEFDSDSVHPIYGSSGAQEVLKQNGYLVQKVKLTECDLEKRAKLLIIAGPQTKFTESEIQILREFLQRDGRILVLLSPPKTCGLEDLFFDWGILADDMLIITVDREHVGLSGDNIIDRFAEHKITKPMLDMQLRAFLGLCQPVRLDIGSPAAKQCKVTSLFLSGEKTFAKLDYIQRKPKYNPAEDLMGPVSVAVLSEEASAENSVPRAGKLLVVGSANFITNHRFCVLGNKILFNSMVTWLLDDADLGSDSINTKATMSYKITLSKSEFTKIGALLLIIPLLFFLMGWVIAHIRKRFR